MQHFRELTRDCIFQKGQSKRIWNELYKVCLIVFLVACCQVIVAQVIDSSDVVIQVSHDVRVPSVDDVVVV